MSPQQPNDPLIGRLVDGRYRVRARIARGGMATVYVATDLRLERRIALKVMHAHLSDDQVFQGRFIQEARAAARLADPHVVNVFDQGQDGELAYLVMEYLPGITLRELLKEQRRLSITQTVTVMDAILAGLAAAHKADIVHRDVKPENVLLAEDGRIKIGDFGLARATTANTASGAQLMGTIAYLAPELVTRGTADARSDIYSLGIMLYEMLVGEQPYRGEQPMQIAFQHATDSVPRPSAKNPAVPEQLDELVLWATEKDPQQRPLDAQVMLDRLREIEREIGVSPAVTDAEPLTGQTVILDEYDTGGQTSVFPVTAATTIAPSETTQTPAPAQPADNATRLRRLTARKQRRGTILLAVVLLLAIIAAGAGWYFGNGPGSRVAVPAVSGQNFESSSAKIDSAGLVAARGEGYSATVPAGEVIETDPESGRQVDKGSTVTLIVSLGPQEHQIPSYLGLSEDEVVKNLKALDIKAAEKDRIYEYSPDAEANTLTWLTIIPANGSDLINCDAGCTAFGGDSAKLYVSLGEFTDVTGMTLKEARASLKSQKLTITNEWGEYNPDVDVDTVIWMSAAPDGRGYRPGDSVDLQYSLGPVAEVAGMTLEKAKAALTAQQISIAAENHEYSDSVPAGQVIAMTGAPEDRFLRPFDSVSLTISDGKRPIVVPDLSGKTIREAMTELGALGLSPTTELPDIFIPTIGNMWDKYYFGSTDPAVGSTLYEGDSITVTVAT